MNLKDAFRYQNKLSSLMEEAQSILRCDSNITTVKTTHLRKKVMEDAENVVIDDTAVTEYTSHITSVARLLMFLLAEKERLAAAIRKAKQDLPIDMDAQVNLNSTRQELARIFGHMADLKSSEVLITNGGTGYRFNAEGNQVSYRCDSKKVTTINFDRNVIRGYLDQIHKQSDQVSTQLDMCLVCSNVDFQPKINVNDSFSAIFETFLRGID